MLKLRKTLEDFENSCRQLKTLSYRLKEIYTSEVKAGDTIICNDGHLRTVGNANIKHDSLMGCSIFGVTYFLSYQKVALVQIARWKNGEKYY